VFFVIFVVAKFELFELLVKKSTTKTRKLKRAAQALAPREHEIFIF
jgi:hypothetical protein